MERKWVARPYRYADGVPWNEDRYEIFIESENGKEWVSVGGAIRSWDKQAVAWLCPKTMQRKIRTPQDAVTRTDGFYVHGRTLKEALVMLRWRWPSPEQTLIELAAFKDFEFDQPTTPRKPPASVPPPDDKKKERG